MLAVLLILVPGIAATLAFAVPSNRWRPWVVTCGAACHAALTVYAVSRPVSPPTLPWFHLDGIALGLYTPPFGTSWIHHTVAAPTTGMLVPTVDAAVETTLHSQL